MGRHDDDRERRSWREIDKARNKSKHVDQTDPYRKRGRGGVRTEGRSKSYRAALDSFFDGGPVSGRFQKLAETREKLSKGGGGSKRQRAIKALRDAVGRFEVEEAVKELLAIDGELPRDPDALLAALQHSDEAIVRQAIALLDELRLERPFKRKSLLEQRLRQVEDLAEEDRTADAANELRKKL